MKHFLCKHCGGRGTDHVCSNPEYPHIPGAVKFRKIANPTAEQRRAHGDAVSAAIRAMQAAALRRACLEPRPSCDSGTWHNNADGKVGAAIRAKQSRDLLTCGDRQRAARTDKELLAAYKEAMAAKRAVVRIDEMAA